MDAEAVLGLQSALEEYLSEFDECMGQSTNPAHLLTYVSGQLGPLERKSIEPIADAAGMSPRTLQAFVGNYHWDHDMLRDKHQQRVVRLHHDDAAIASLDGTTFPKKGQSPRRPTAVLRVAGQEGQLREQRVPWVLHAHVQHADRR